MNLRSTTAAAALVIGTLTVGLGTAHADPAPAPAAAAINYSVKLVDKTVVTKLKEGTFELEEQKVAATETTAEDVTMVANIKDDAGNVVMAMPLEYEAAGVEIPVTPVLKEDGKVLELAVTKPADLPAGQMFNTPAMKTPVLQDVASPVENQRAMGEFSTQFGIATAVGGFVGTAVGVVAGFIIGCGLAIVIACLPLAIPFAGIGGILGTLAVGGPTLIGAGVELMNTLNAPDGTTKWADKPK